MLLLQKGFSLESDCMDFLDISQYLGKHLNLSGLIVSFCRTYPLNLDTSSNSSFNMTCFCKAEFVLVDLEVCLFAFALQR